ncbi:FAD/NAD(P)-binding oxidoreductase [Pseudorhizobium endolithicum]|uniref:FAD/NAD(P)-binding oxidoreductase n=1 Tax=Pseudorhizobium endolithicum TaxID=1191678 RepID=A0ABN7JR33_9HYPH|nr:NAD(P)/FAD-dependent oxidoreductase [Pseudorhizobium endolithicum]CAD7035674.1 FAD/NAD(P)-binding oxidoreductase [Pseudorhizobium endolithicum]
MGHYDLIIVGAGPAGMAAAVKAGACGLRVLILDEQARPGGQIYRNVEILAPHLRQALGEDYSRGEDATRALQNSLVEYRPNATVLHLDQGRSIVWSQHDGLHSASAKRFILSTGALERPFPIDGWTLPGVMTVGAAQIALKSGGAAADNAVLAGSGPLLWLVASQYLRLGLKPRAVLDTAPPENYVQALRQWRGAVAGRELLLKGWHLQREVRASGTPVYRNVSDLWASGKRRLESVGFRTHTGWHRLDAVSHLFLHQGLVPNDQLAAIAGCERHWNSRQLSWQVITDPYGRTSIPSIFVAGDAMWIAGADSAALTGQVAAVCVASDLGHLPADLYALELERLMKSVQEQARIRAFLDILFRPPRWAVVPREEETVICRCEDVQMKHLDDYLSAGGDDINEFKSATRCGMGPCQGRLCAPTVAAILADRGQLPGGKARPPRPRPPASPVSLDQLAALSGDGCRQ